MIINKSRPEVDYAPLKSDISKGRMQRDSSGITIEHTSDTINTSEQYSDSLTQQSFYTSTPKSLGIVCEECRKNARRLLMQGVT
jgi:hypothetical protein